MTPLAYYRKQCLNGTLVEDPEQLIALHFLQKVYDDVLIEQKKRTGFFSLFHKAHRVKGVYLWGSVGVGKTFLMDCFYECLPFPEKMRMHFHQFMRLTHQQLKKHQGEKDPLYVIAKELAQKTVVLCFDELFVSDIADAMLLGRLLRALFAEGVCLVCTSNTEPDELYKNGLQRDSFLPAIAMIKQATHIVHIPTKVDYRLRHLQEAGVFYHSDDKKAAAQMEKTFALLAENQTISMDPIILYDRNIPIRKRAGKIIWFDFNVICAVPRSQQDYLAIAEQYDTVFISDIPNIPAHAKDTISFFINLIDVLYDAHTRLVFSAEAPLEEIYQRGSMTLEYSRTHSRLQEMQSEDYFLR